MREKIIKIELLLSVINEFENKFYSERILEIKDLLLQERKDILSKLTEEGYDKKIENEKKTFKKNIFNPEILLKNLTGYSDKEKRSAINSFLSDIVEIKECFNENNQNGYQHTRKWRGNNKNYMKNFYQDLKKYTSGLNTEVYRSKLYEIFNLNHKNTENLEQKIKKINDAMNESRNEYINYIKKLLKSSLTDPYDCSQFNYLINNFFNFYSQNEKISQKSKEEHVSSLEENFKFLERVKYMTFSFLDIIYLSNKEKEFINKQNEIIKKLKFYIEKVKESNIKVSEKAKSEYYYKEYINKYKYIFDEPYDFSLLTKEIKKLKYSKEIDKERIEKIIYKYYYLIEIEYDNLNSIKDCISFHYISWLIINDLMAELYLYLEIIDNILKNNNKEKIDISNLNFLYLEKESMKKLEDKYSETREEYIKFFKEYKEILNKKIYVFSLFCDLKTYKKLIISCIEILEEVNTNIPHLYTITNALEFFRQIILM